MLRFSNLNKVASLLHGGVFCGRFTLRRTFANEKAQSDDQVEAAEEIIAEGTEVQVEKEGEETITKPKEREWLGPSRVYGKVNLKASENLQTAVAEYEALITGPNYGPFTFNKRAEDITDEQLAKLHKEAFDTMDMARDIRIRIGHAVTNLSDPNFPEPNVLYEKIEDLINKGYTRGEYEVIFERDFRTLIFQTEFLPHLQMFLKKEFMDANSHIYTDSELLTTLKQIQRNEEFMPLLEFIKFIRPSKSDRPSSFAHSSLSEETENFLARFGSSQKYNYMALVHHIVNSTKGSFVGSIDFSLFAEKLMNVYWGSSSTRPERQRFYSHLYDMLLIKLNIQENQALKYYLADMFMTAPTYEEGLCILGNTLLIFNRLLNGSTDCNDLYFTFTQKFGENKFNFYIKEKLPAVFALIRKKKLVTLCKQSVEAFQAGNFQSQADIKPVIIDLLDQNFYRKDSKVIYAHDNNSPLDFYTRFSFYPEKKKTEKSVEDESELVKKAVVNGNSREFVRIFETECSRDSTSRQIYQNLTQEYIDNPKKLEKLSDDKTFDLLKRLTNELEDQFFPYNHLDKMHNRISNKPRRSSQMVREQPRPPKSLSGAPQKEFSTFLGTNRKAIASSGLTYKSIRGFSNEEEVPQGKTNEKSEKGKSSPFKNFLRKAEEIDKIVEEQKMTQEDVKKMKKALFDSRKEGTEGEKVVFSKIETLKPQRTQTEKLTNAYVLASDYWDKLIQDKTDVNDITTIIEHHFLTINDLIKAQNAIENFLNSEPLLTKGITDHKLFFYKMFNQPQLKKVTPEELQKLNLHVNQDQLTLQPSDKLEISIETSYGLVEKDYNKYLTSTLFHYGLGENGYKGILEVLKDDYKRRFFKKCVAHMALYSTDISIKNLELIAEICYQEKIALTLIETAQLFIKNGLINRPEQLNVIIDKLRFFKDLSDSSEHLAKSFSHFTGLPFSVSFMGSHLDLLMKYGKYDKFMPIFDRLKDYLGNKKLKYDENLSAEENIKRQEQFRTENKQVLAQLYRDFIERLNTHKIYSFSKLLYKEQIELKLASNLQDYLNAIQINKDQPQEIEPILKAAKTSEDRQFVEKIVYAVLDAVSENPRVLKPLVEKILDEIVYTERLEINNHLVQRVAMAMSRTADSTPLQRFLDYLQNSGPPLKYHIKLHFLRLLNASEDNLTKPTLVGQVERLFSKEMQERIKERDEMRKRRQAAAKKLEAEGGQEAGKAEASEEAKKAEEAAAKVEAAKTEGKKDVKKDPKKEKKVKKGKGKEAEEAKEPEKTEAEAKGVAAAGATGKKKKGPKKQKFLLQTEQVTVFSRARLPVKREIRIKGNAMRKFEMLAETIEEAEAPAEEK